MSNKTGSSSMSKDKNIVSMQKKNKSGTISRKKHYIVRGKAFSKSTGIKLFNGHELFANGGPQILVPPSNQIRGFRSYPVTPHFHFSRKNGRAPCDIEIMGDYWFVSQRIKSIFAERFPLNVSFMDVCFDTAPGLESKQYALCDIISISDDIDIDKSSVRIFTDSTGKDIIQLGLDMKLSFKDSLPSECHIFRLASSPDIIVADDVFVDCVKEYKITGLYFQKAF